MTDTRNIEYSRSEYPYKPCRKGNACLKISQCFDRIGIIDRESTVGRIKCFRNVFVIPDLVIVEKRYETYQIKLWGLTKIKTMPDA